MLKANDQGHSPLVLVVEDNEMNQRLACRILSLNGFATELACTGREAVDKASQGFDLILMDVQLPDMDGLTATRIIKEAESTRHIPIVGVSALARTEDCKRALAAGCDAYMTKPYSIAQLLETVSQVLSEAT